MFKKIWSNIGTRFVAVGVVNTLIDFAVLNLLVFAFSLNKLAANTVSVTIAMAVSYLLNHNIVFRQTGQNHFKKIILFLVITAFGLWVLQNLTIYALIHWFAWPSATVKSILDLIGLDNLSNNFVVLNTAKILGTIISLLWNFFMYRRFVFTEKAEQLKNAQE